MRPEYPQRGQVWVHFKGQQYQIVRLALDVSDGSFTERISVVYELPGDDHETYLRPVSNFLQHVERPGYTGPRFTRIS